MSTFDGVIFSPSGSGVITPGLSGNVRPPERWTTPRFRDEFGDEPAGAFTRETPTARRRQSWGGALAAYPGDDFFEKLHVRPRSHVLGVIFADQTIALHIYNAYRRESRFLNAFVNNAGAGITIPDLPSLPYEILSQNGLHLTLVVDSTGPANVSGTLDFEFDTTTISVPITATRALVMPFEPLAPFGERLQFKTDVMTAASGIEQRRSLRHAPRQIFDFTMSLDGAARRVYDSLVYDFHSRIIGVPVWFEPSLTTARVVPLDTSVPVQTSAYSDLRVGSLAILWNSETLYEVLEVAAVNPTSVNFSSGFTKTFPKGSRVMPIRLGYPVGDLHGEKFPQNLQTARVVFRVTDNDLDLSDASAFGEFGGRVLVDDPNLADPSLGETWNRPAFDVDGETGTFNVFTDAPNARRSYPRTFVTNTRQRLWEVRQLLHFLRGRQTSFWSPTDAEELVPTLNVSAGGNTLTVENVGFTKFVRQRLPRSAIRVVLRDGTKIARLVTGSIELSESLERLTISGSWPTDFLVSEVLRVEYFERIRLDSDEVQIRHLSGRGDAVITVPVVGVYE